MSQVISIIWIVVLFAVFYLLLIRPQQQRAKRHQELIAQIKVGDKIETIGGIHGRVVGMKEGGFEIEVASGVVITVSRRAVSARLELETDKKASASK